MSEGRYQNGGLWDWWGGVQISAEFEQGHSQKGLAHLRLTAADWARHPQDLAEWTLVADNSLQGASDYGASGGTLGQAIVQGLFGVKLSAGELQLNPRLMDSNGFARVYLPASDRYVAYCYGKGERKIRLEYGTNHGEPFPLRVTLPPQYEALSVFLDGQEVPFNPFALGEDELFELTAPPGRHSIEVLCGED
jgi:hypothetical protein